MGTKILACSRLGEPRRCNQGVQRPITGDRVLDSRLMRVIAILTLIGLLGTASESRARQDQSAVEQLAQEGWTAVQAERFGEALTAFNTALESAPREPTLWLGAGAAAFMLGRDDQAQAALEQALDLNPQLVEAARFLGELYHRRGQVERAINLYADALAVAPDDAHLAEKLEDWERAELRRVLTHEYVHAMVAQLGGRHEVGSTSGWCRCARSMKGSRQLWSLAVWTVRPRRSRQCRAGHHFVPCTVALRGSRERTRASPTPTARSPSTV